MQPRLISNENSKPSCTVSVRCLVDHLLRSGDLHFDVFGSVAAADGIRAHQQIQRSRPQGYQPEVAVRLEVEHTELQLCVTGRIDGVLIEDGRTVVEEIKTTRRSRSELVQTPNPLHWGQAQCYAYMWAVREKVASVVVRLTYMNVDSGKIHQFEQVWQMAALEAFFDDLVSRYRAWIIGRVHWVRLRDRSINRLVFPFDTYRTGQREMAVAVYRNIRDQGHLLVQAATGIGKTMGALFPAIKALGDGLAEKVVFLTARGTGRLAAESALETLAVNGLRLKSVTLSAKDKICFNAEAACAPDTCQWARGYYDRVNGALADALDHDDLTRDRIERIAGQHRVCPFEFSLELVTWADCVICDYNYAFAPGVMLQRLFGEEGGRHVLLVDEAHNLVDRSREMFSAQLAKEPLLAVRRLLKGHLPGIHGALGRINSWMAAQRRRCDKEAGRELIEEELPVILIDRLKVFLRTAERWLALNIQTPFRDVLQDLFFEVLHFVRVAEMFDKRYTAIYQASSKGLRIKLFCVDPSHQLQSSWKRCRSAVLFSATLTPGGYFQSVLGCSEQATMLNLPSPFPSSNLGVFVADQITTLYRRRQDTCRAVTRTIAGLIRQRPGHYMLFFPSYEYLQMVYRLFRDECADLATVIQTPEMDEQARTAFLSNFEKAAGNTLVGFVVMGGIFGEAINLKGERLIGAVIVGVGLPGISLERNLIRDYYRTRACGFEFAYQYPGINRVLQAAGRVIRTEKDQGTLLLIDHRYGQQRYRRLLPPHWQLRVVDNEFGFQQQVRTFWEGEALRN